MLIIGCDYHPGSSKLHLWTQKPVRWTNDG